MKNFTEQYIAQLNKAYKERTPLDRLKQLFQDFCPEDILVTSSFGTTSGILLGMVSKAAPGHPIHFIDTTFCFPETLEYKETLTNILDLHIIDILPDVEDNLNAREREMWKSDPDQCCFLNKVKPFQHLKDSKKVWVSGLLANQTPFRKNLDIFELRNGNLKMHPNIDTPEAAFDQFLTENNIPPHPLKDLGFNSVGCTHCTKKGQGREGRWAGNSKVECGIHTT